MKIEEIEKMRGEIWGCFKSYQQDMLSESVVLRIMDIFNQHTESLISTIRREAVEGFYTRLLAEWVKTNGFEYGDKTMKEVMEDYLQENNQ